MNMSDRTHHDDDTVSAPSASMVLMIFGTMADTTWRIAIPPIFGTIVGVWVDNTYNTKPWATVAGVTLGTAAAFYLLYLQMRKVRQ